MYVRWTKFHLDEIPSHRISSALSKNNDIPTMSEMLPILVVIRAANATL